LRTQGIAGHYDARECLSTGTLALYEAVKKVVGKPISLDRPYIWNDNEQSLNQHIALIAADIAKEGQIVQAVKETLVSLK
jgi:phenylalanine ammonia-lyase